MEEDEGRSHSGERHRKEGAWGGSTLGKHVLGRRVHWHMFDIVTRGGGHI
jgi:hypothetical protein